MFECFKIHRESFGACCPRHPITNLSLTPSDIYTQNIYIIGICIFSPSDKNRGLHTIYSAPGLSHLLYLKGYTLINNTLQEWPIITFYGQNSANISNHYKGI